MIILIEILQIQKKDIDLLINQSRNIYSLTKSNIMKTKLKEFTIQLNTIWGFGIIRKKANSFEDAFKRIGKKDKDRTNDIWDENGEHISPSLLTQLQNQ